MPSSAVTAPLVSFGTLAALVGLSFISLSWIVWTVMMAAMLVVIGPRHPRTIDEHVPLDRARVWVAAFALVMFVLCFTPVPADLVDLVARGPSERPAADLCRASQC